MAKTKKSSTAKAKKSPAPKKKDVAKKVVDIKNEGTVVAKPKKKKATKKKEEVKPQAPKINSVAGLSKNNYKPSPKPTTPDWYKDGYIGDPGVAAVTKGKK